MKNRMKWTRIGLAGILTVSLVGAPQIAAAADRCDRQSYYNTGGYQTYYHGGDNRGYGYGDPGGYYRDYRDQGYRNSGYRNDGYYDNGYRDYGYRDNRYYGDDYGYYRSERSAGKSAAIIGGSSAAGAVFGALAGGGKGAAIGAALGGIGGLIFDRATRNDGRQH
jgi:hypothetical protein